MPAINILGIYIIIPVTLFLTISFFVLLGADKTESACLKKFGRIVAGLLWICAALLLGTGLYTLITGDHPALPLIQYLISK